LPPFFWTVLIEETRFFSGEAMFLFSRSPSSSPCCLLCSEVSLRRSVTPWILLAVFFASADRVHLAFSFSLCPTLGPTPPLPAPSSRSDVSFSSNFFLVSLFRVQVGTFSPPPGVVARDFSFLREGRLPISISVSRPPAFVEIFRSAARTYAP